jgi:enediyne biosynthesis protein E4
LSAVAHIDEFKTGRFYTDEFRGQSSWNGYEWNNLLRNDGNAADGVPRFSDVACALGADDDRDSRGIAVADFDNDGDLDIAINHNPGDSGIAERAGATFLENHVGDHHHWLAVELVGRHTNRDAIGAEVTISTGELGQVRQVSAGSSYAGQHGKRLYFGLGDHTRADTLIVRWPDGSLSEKYFDIEADRLARIVEDEGMELRPLRGPLKVPASSRGGH